MVHRDGQIYPSPLFSLRSIESLYQELVEQGLLKPADDVKLQDYIGLYQYFIWQVDFSCFWYELEQLVCCHKMNVTIQRNI